MIHFGGRPALPLVLAEDVCQPFQSSITESLWIVLWKTRFRTDGIILVLFGVKCGGGHDCLLPLCAEMDQSYEITR